MKYLNPILSTLLLIGVLLLFAGCIPREEQSDTQPLAKVGNQVLSLQQALSSVPQQQLGKDSIRALLNFRSQWVRKQLMLQEAKRLNLDKQASIRKKVKQLKQDIYVEALQQYILSNRANRISTSREEARNYYQQHKDKFTLKERHVRFRHMIANSIKNAEKARSELLGGVSWNQVADKYHINIQLALNRSDRFVPISMATSDNPQMQRFLKVIGIREISPIRYHNGNYHFVQLMEERPAGHNPDLDWMLENIEEWLAVKKKKEELNAYLKNLYLRARANNEIETYDVFESDSIGNRPFNDTNQSAFYE